MATKKESLFFNYAGQWSSEFGILHVTMDSSMYEETFVAGREIVEEQVRGNSNPYFSHIRENPLEFDLMFAFEETFDNKVIREILNWLYQGYYQPLYFSEEPDRIYYCMPISDSKIVHNGLKEGYVQIKMRCNSPYIYSPMYMTDLFDLSESKGKAKVILRNSGDVETFPEVSLTKIGDGKVTIINHSDGGKIFEILNLKDKEDIYINCEKELIETSLSGVYRYSNVVGDYLMLMYGDNQLEVEGNCKIKFRYQNRFRF
ncbi:distal tail protein Dit [Bacillus thuringiensis]|uniref:distal tail protein Dit n=1 Tax=Bacillus thuringiensis TaxID=1428 RepID=UPI003F5AF177